MYSFIHYKWKTTNLYQACQISTTLGMGCIDQGPLWSDLELLLQCQLASRRGKILLRHFVCRSHSLMKIFTGKAGLPSLARYFSGSLVQHGPAESCLVGLLALLAGPVVVLPDLTGTVLVRYNPDQNVYSPGKSAIYSRLARDVRPLMSCIEQGPLWSGL